MPKLERGTQIIYVPDHAHGETAHPDCEEGFVTSVDPERNVAWCRYWMDDANRLRTRSCSEMTPIENLVIEDTRSQRIVEINLENLSPGPCDGCRKDCRLTFPACIKQVFEPRGQS